MKILIVYDSIFGNTEKIARAICDALKSGADVYIGKVDQIKPDQCSEIDLLVVGSPTRAFSPTPAIKKILKQIRGKSLRGTRVAAFDTRMTESDIESGPKILKILAGIFRYAAESIARRLIKKGGTLILSPEGFYVSGTEGPLLEGELDRAADWARQIITSL